MRLTRCFVPMPLRERSELLLPEAAALHVARVLRLREGAALTLFDGHGGEFDGKILGVQRDSVRVAVGAHRAIEREAPVTTVLLQSLARGERMDLIVQKATELGVSAVVPLSTDYSVVRLDAAAAARRREHWQQIAISACEQCGRNRIPTVYELTDVTQGCSQAEVPPRRWILTPEADVALAEALRTEAADAVAGAMALLLGPEGGWSPQELAVARELGFRACHLGPRILRAETAPLAALASVQAVVGDFR